MTGKGDCYVVAFNIVVGTSHLWLCHGQPINRGRHKGKRYDHAWVEYKDAKGEVHVIDKSNGLDLEMSRDLYYLIGRIEPSKVKRYTSREACRLAVTTEHYGPWSD